MRRHSAFGHGAWWGVALLGSCGSPAERLPPFDVESGLAGPCDSTTESFPNPADAGETVYVYAPAGATAAPLTGGTCDDDARPVVFFSHGLAARSPGMYRDAIDHVVSQGNFVVFASYSTLSAFPTDPTSAYAIVDAGYAAAALDDPRMDLSRVGFMGHSVGGGMLPFLVQQGASRGWGESGLFVFGMAMYYAFSVGTGPIAIPSHAEVLVESYDDDTTLDNRIAIEIFHGLDLPYSQKQHVTVLSQTYGGATLDATHNVPQTRASTTGTPLHRYGVFRNVDLLEACAFDGTHCDADLATMGEWPDGAAVTPAISTDAPIDVGPGAVAACDSFLNPRDVANCPPSSL